MARDIVQLYNPRSKKYIKVDREKGEIIGYKKTPGPYLNIPLSVLQSKEATRGV
jgi:hypothetical protein